MIQEYYSVFYSKTKSQLVSNLLARMLYCFILIKYSLKSVYTRNLYVNTKDAYKTVFGLFSKTDYNIVCKSAELNANTDISVIIPVYNYKDEIKKCIDSVIFQKTQYSFEVILVDDGSTDGSSEIVDAYAEYDNIVIIHKENGGIASARNTGLNNAHGKYIMFVDCDDVVHSDYIESMLNKAYETNVDIVICGYTLVKRSEDKEISRRDIIYSSKNLMKYCGANALLMNYQGLPWNKIYKRELFEKIRYIPNYWYEDEIVHFLVFRKCKSFEYIPKSFYDYSWYEKNFSHTQNKSTPQSLQLYWMLEVMVDENKRVGLPDDAAFYEVLLRHMSGEMVKGISSFDDEIKHAVFTLCSDLLKEHKPTEKYKLRFIDRKIEKALLTNNYSKWELASQYR